MLPNWRVTIYILASKQGYFCVKARAINNYAGTPGINGNCPGQTGTFRSCHRKVLPCVSWLLGDRSFTPHHSSSCSFPSNHDDLDSAPLTVLPLHPRPLPAGFPLSGLAHHWLPPPPPTDLHSVRFWGDSFLTIRFFKIWALKKANLWLSSNVCVHNLRMQSELSKASHENDCLQLDSLLLGI